LGGFWNGGQIPGSYQLRYIPTITHQRTGSSFGAAFSSLMKFHNKSEIKKMKWVFGGFQKSRSEKIPVFGFQCVAKYIKKDD
jgi:hypothetical protein